MVTVFFFLGGGGLRRPWPGTNHPLPSFSAEVLNALELEPSSDSPLGMHLHVIGYPFFFLILRSRAVRDKEYVFQSYFSAYVSSRTFQIKNKTTPSRLNNYINHHEVHFQDRKGLCLTLLYPELNPICCLLALLGAHHFLHVSRIRVILLTFRRLMSYIYIYIWSTHS